MKILLILAKALQKQKSNFSQNALFHMKTRLVSLKYFLNDSGSHRRRLDVPFRT